MFSFKMITMQYADDLCVIVQNDEESVVELLAEMDRFYDFSGLRINLKKTLAFKLGPCRRDPSDPKSYRLNKIAWTDQPVKMLGVWFYPNKEMMEQLNFQNKLDIVKGVFDIWSTRKLAVMGKITIINSLAISQFIYQFSALPTPSQGFFKNFKHLVMEFLWGKQTSENKV